MNRRSAVAFTGITICAAFFLLAGVAAPETFVAPGALISPAGICPLKHTDVKGEISGFLARVNVTQEFQNPFPEKIEAVYTFPLPTHAAVDDMTMLVGARTIRGIIKTREEARAIYEAARTSGHVAGLLDQERPNIFTQSVANIMPGESVRILISYVEILNYENGSYEFSFPMVVGPRYIPGNPTGRQGGGWAPDTDRVRDASRITPRVAAPGTRAGHDISIQVSLDAGVPLRNVEARTHEVALTQPNANQAVVQLKDQAVIPNKDFVLKYDVAGGRVEDAVLVHSAGRGGFFTLILQPPQRPAIQDLSPKELIFLLDTSGSMHGFPIEKAKEAMKLALDGLYPQDTFNVITFSGYTEILFPEPVPATRENIQTAQEFLAGRQGAGGTEMMRAIKAALDPSDSQDHVRIVCFMTDGYVGNDLEIIGEVQKHPNARVFAFGIGSSVNHFLLDNIAKYGRGEVDYVGLKDDGSAAARRFHERVRSPLLTDIALDWSNLPVKDIYPARIPDLFAARPLVLTGRFDGPASGTVHLRGKMAGSDFTRDIPVNLPYAEPSHDVLATLWARQQVDDLMSKDFTGMQRGAMKPDTQAAITQLGLTYRLMTQFTSFVAVEERTITTGGQPKVVQVPVETPEGVSYEGVFGQLEQFAKLQKAPRQFVGGVPGGMPGGVVGGVIGSVPSAAPPPPPPPPPAAMGAYNQTITVQGRNVPGSGGGIGSGSGGGVGSPQGNRQREQQLLKTMRPSLAALILHPETASKSNLVKNGQVEIQVWLTDAAPATIARLNQLGFEVTANTGKIVIGRLPVDKLTMLAELKSVRYIAPYGHY